MQIQVDPPGDSESINLGISEVGGARLIGQGGFSKVYAATDRHLARPVAVKVLDEFMTEAAQRRFARECEIMGRLSRHHNVVTVHSAGVTDEGHPYLIMDLLGGGSLDERLRQAGPAPWPEALRCIIPVAEAVEAAHQLGILHRDIKPGNILLDEAGVPHLTDFGIATRPQIPSDTTSSVVASWKHSPPETMDDQRDERSDVYSLASTLYHLIAGHAPFAGDDQPTFTVMMRRVAGGPPPEIPAEVCPPALNRFFARALAANPDERPQTMAQVVDELRAVAEGTHEPVGGRDRRRAPGDGSRWSRVVSALTSTPVLIGVGTIAAVATAVVTLAVINRSEDQRSADSPVHAPADTPAGEPVGLPADDGAARTGTMTSPYPVGQNVEVFYDDDGVERRWHVQVIEPVRANGDGTGGEAVARLRIRYTDGAAPGPLSQLRFSAVDPSGTSHPADPDGCGSEFGVIDLQLAMAAGQAVEGSICWPVTNAEVATLILAVEAEPAQGVAYLALE